MSSDLKYYPLLFEVFYTEIRYMSIEEVGFFIQLILYQFTEKKPIKDAKHAARIANIDPRVSSRLFKKISDKFVKNQHGYSHKLTTKILRNDGRIKGLYKVADEGGFLPQELELEEPPIPPLTGDAQNRSLNDATHLQNAKRKRKQNDPFAESIFGSSDPGICS
ncbi:MAG: YdaU family protein [Candidatus Thiodiazotropha sp. (ex Ctena orbiculata)]|nr:YdaU family protein [Candidatus Thiodiazotropha taylori]